MLLNLHRNPNTFHFNNINKFKNLLLYALKKEALSPKKTCHIYLSRTISGAYTTTFPPSIFISSPEQFPHSLYMLLVAFFHTQEICEEPHWYSGLDLTSFSATTEEAKAACSFGTHFTLGRNHKKMFGSKVKKALLPILKGVRYLHTTVIV